MRKCLSYIFLLAVVLGLNSCDFLRKAAGRPTSGDIAVMRQKIVSDSLQKKAVHDSLESARQARLAYLSDSLAVCDSLAALRCYIKNFDDIKAKTRPALAARYWLVTGAFKNPDYAKSRQDKLKAAGFESEAVSFGNTLIVVIAAPNNTIRGIFDDFKRFSVSSLAVPDVWILDAVTPASAENE